MASYARAGPSQGKLWWQSVSILTCKSFVRSGYGVDRIIEPSGSWFPPNFPSGLLWFSQRYLHLVKRMIRSIRGDFRP